MVVQTLLFMAAAPRFLAVQGRDNHRFARSIVPIANNNTAGG
jgi:hypothetical protein